MLSVGEQTQVDWTEMDRRERDTREALDSVLFWPQETLVR